MALRTIIDCSTGEQTTVETPDEAPPPSPVPDTISARQLKLALLAANLLDPIDTFVASQDRAVQISWEYATEFSRDYPLLNQMGVAFGMSPDQMDAIFRSAAAL